jgi:hypothetical protein
MFNYSFNRAFKEYSKLISFGANTLGLRVNVQQQSSLRSGNQTLGGKYFQLHSEQGTERKGNLSGHINSMEEVKLKSVVC